MSGKADEQALLVVSAAALRGAVHGLETKVIPQPEAQQALTPVQRGAIMARLAAAMQQMDKESKGIDPELLVASRDPVASMIQSKIAEDKRGELIPLAAGHGYEIKFEEPQDWVGWGLSVLEWIHSKNHDQEHPEAGVVHDMPNDARVAIVGDWGTGMYAAPLTAKTIAALRESYFMQLHLGDVYYAGTPTEVETRFLRFWIKRPEAISRSLNGNHEMYSGGYGYFDGILKKFEQPSSYFAHQNDKWLLIAMDTAYVDHNLAQEQLQWLMQVVLGANGRKVVLFSHHQPFSKFDDDGKNLRATIQTLLNNKSIHYWYWGHEHRCVWYDAHPQWGLRGRCIGHGGIPYHREPVINKPFVGTGEFGWRRMEPNDGFSGCGCHVLDGPNNYVDQKYHPEKFGPQGFVTLRFNGDQLNEEIRLPDGTPVPLPPLQ